MYRPMVRWATGALIALVPLAFVGWPVLAQQPCKPPLGEVNRAKEMAALIEQGQLNLRDATAIAEKHVHGVALQAACNIEGAEPAPVPKAPPLEPERPRGPSVQKEPSDGKRLIYEISCFAKDRLELVRVDGLTKTVLDAEHK